MQTQSRITTAPLSHLQISPKNSRKKRTKAQIEATWESIKAHSQLQNLVVTPADTPGHFLVDAGGTRLLAFQLGFERGEIPADHPIDIKVIPDSEALEASTAENTIRETMHPADQFRAWKRMIDESGKSIAEVAAHFSVAPSVVEGRLKLANVDPELFEIYENGQMKLEQLQALALTDSHDDQRRAWFGRKGAKVEHDWQRTAAEIRKRITAKEVGPDNKLVQFVGVDAYERAGGTVRRDMFSSDVFFNDAKLLEKIAAEKFDALAAREIAEGWSWVETHLALDYSAQSRYGRAFEAAYRTSTADEKKRIEQIDARCQEIEDLIDNDEAADYATLDAERDQLSAERETIMQARQQWSAEAKAKSGVLIFIDHHGLRVERGRLKPGQRLTEENKVTGGKDGVPKKPELSADMVLRLEMQRAAAIRYHVALCPKQALVLLLTHMAARLLTKTSAESVLGIDPTHAHRDARSLIDSKFKELGSAPAREALDMRIKAWREAGLPDKASDLPGWIQRLTQDKQIELLALLVALTIPTLPGVRGATLADQFDVDMRQWWSATPENFTSLVPKAMLALAVGEVQGKPAAEAILLQNKAGATADATRALANSGWLPKPLRGKAYDKTPTPSAALTPAVGKPKPSSKPAPKNPAVNGATPKKLATTKKTAAKKPVAKKAAGKKAVAPKPTKKRGKGGGK
jgi:ParB family transcriptional regulator, chromosome partitioning protein